MITGLIDYCELKRILALWTLENDIGAFLPQGVSEEEYIEDFRIPETNGEHTQSAPDSDGNINTLIKHEITLKDWQTKHGKNDMTFVYYEVLKTLTQTPDIEPYISGYIAVY